MTSITSRRAILAGAAALPALSVPAIAGTQPLDPIFAAIEAHRAAEKRYSEAIVATGASEGRFRDGCGRLTPDGLPKEARAAFAEHIPEVPGLANARVPTHESIDRLVDWPADIRDVLHRELDRQTALYAQTVEPAKEVQDAANDAAQDAAWAILDVRPTTLAGATALLAYAADYGDNWVDSPDSDCCDRWEDRMCEMLADALEAIARKAVQS